MAEDKEVRRQTETAAMLEEKQRDRLLRDFQDGPAQKLASIISALELIATSLERDPQVVAAELARVKELVTKALDQVQEMIFTLRPTILTTEGLGPALEVYAGQLGKGKLGRKVMDVHAQIAGLERRVPRKVEEAAFDVVREALRNVRQHAEARNVWLKAVRSGKELRITVVDDGRGFRPKKAHRQPPGQWRTGLHYMEERAGDVGGQLEIDSKPGQGTAIRLVVPLR